MLERLVFRVHLHQLLLCVSEAAELADGSLPQLVQTVGLLLRPHDLIPHLLLQVLFLLCDVAFFFLCLRKSEQVDVVLDDHTIQSKFINVQKVRDTDWRILTVPADL